MKKKNNENIDINTIMAMFVAYMQQQMDYTEMKMDAMTEWQTEDCGCSGCEKKELLQSQKMLSIPSMMSSQRSGCNVRMETKCERPIVGCF